MMQYLRPAGGPQGASRPLGGNGHRGLNQALLGGGRGGHQRRGRWEVLGGGGHRDDNGHTNDLVVGGGGGAAGETGAEAAHVDCMASKERRRV